MNKNRTDWNLVTQAQISIAWLFATVQNADQEIGNALKKFREANENCEVINPGILTAFAYIVLVYPYETSAVEIDVNKLDCSKFVIKSGKQSKIIDKLRHSIAHGLFSIAANASITFKSGRDSFESEISCGDFGTFVQSYCSELKKAAFQKEKNNHQT